MSDKLLTRAEVDQIATETYKLSVSGRISVPPEYLTRLARDLTAARNALAALLTREPVVRSFVVNAWICNWCSEVIDHDSWKIDHREDCPVAIAKAQLPEDW